MACSNSDQILPNSFDASYITSATTAFSLENTLDSNLWA